MDLVIGKTARFVFMTTVERKRHYGVALAANKTAESHLPIILTRRKIKENGNSNSAVAYA